MPDPDTDPMPPTPAVEALREAVERARRGDRDALPALRAALDEHPEVWEHYGDLAAHAGLAWIELTAGPDLALGEALGRKVAALKAELAGPAPTPLERLLAARVASNWVMLHHADAALAQAGEVSIRQADLAQKRQARAHRAYVASIAALATVRRLLPATPDPAEIKAVAGPPTTENPSLEGPPARHPGVSRDVIPAAGRGGRAAGPIGPATLALFDRPGDEPVPGKGAGRPRGGRPRSAS